MGLLTMKHGTISIDSLPQPLNRIIMWLERSEYLLYQSDESRVSSVESARMLVEEVQVRNKIDFCTHRFDILPPINILQKHWESYMRVNSELLSIYTNLCDNLVTGEVLNDIAARLRRFSREIPTISLKLKYHLIKIR